MQSQHLSVRRSNNGVCVRKVAVHRLPRPRRRTDAQKRPRKTRRMSCSNNIYKQYPPLIIFMVIFSSLRARQVSAAPRIAMHISPRLRQEQCVRRSRCASGTPDIKRRIAFRIVYRRSVRPSSRADSRFLFHSVRPIPFVNATQEAIAFAGRPASAAIFIATLLSAVQSASERLKSGLSAARLHRRVPARAQGRAKEGIVPLFSIWKYCFQSKF